VTKPIIPDAALGQHIAVLGKTGSGKTFAAKASIIEPLLERGRRVGIVDPTDAWWGLRSSRDGKGAGFPVLVLGGDHGDLPLPANGGAAVARLLVEQGVNLVASTKHLTVGERTRWFIDFAGTVSRLNRAPLHLVLDEAHNFAPQGKVPDPDTGKMLHAANTLASGGRSIGIRLVMITQRPQKLHKDTLTSADTLIAMRVLAPHDRMAVEDWIKGCGDLAQGKEVLNSLAGLTRGEGWVWYPEGGHLQRTKFPQIRTFDSSATPTEGHAIQAPKAAAEIDLTEINKALAEAVREAEANDPKLLRAEVARLKAAAKKAGRVSEVEVIDPNKLIEAENRGYRRGREEGEQAMRQAGDTISGIAKRLPGITTELATVQLRLYNAANAAPAPLQRRPTPAPPLRQRQATTAPAVGSAGNGSLPKSERLILTALAQYPDGRKKAQVAVLTGYAVNGGAFNNSLGALRSRSLITRGEPMQITDPGLRELGTYDPLPVGPALLDYWMGNLGKAERLILNAVADAYPSSLNKHQTAVAAGYEANGGAFNNALGRLRSLELIRGRGEIKASDDLFE
jgi:hypothetical protein